MVDRDPFDVLREAWGQVQPPSADRDVATDALVDDLRAAWRQIEAPRADLQQFQAALREHRRAILWRDRAILVAAASLLFALIITASQARSRADRESDQLATHDETVNDDATEDDLQSAAEDARVKLLNPAVRARALENGDLELRHGRVRLLLGGQTDTIIETHEPVAQSAADDEEETK